MNKLRRTIILFCVVLSCSCSPSLFGIPTKVAHLIPENYIGGVIILYNQPDGIVPETSEDGTVIYRIPSDGFLKVKSPLRRISYKFNYYFVDAKDKRTSIEYLHPEYYVRDRDDTTSKSHDSISEDERMNQTFVMDHETTHFNIGEEKVYLRSFIIDKPMDSLKTFRETERRVFDIQKGFLNIKSEPKNY